MTSGSFNSNNAPQKKGPSNAVKGIVGIVVIIVIIAVIASMAGGSGTSTPTSTSGHSVEYRVTGSASTVSLTYQNADGGTSQIASAPLPWTLTFTAHSGDFVYISAQNNGDSGTVTTAVYEDGVVFHTSTSSGAYVIADASGSLP